MVLTTLNAVLSQSAPAFDQSTGLRLIVDEGSGIQLAININGEILDSRPHDTHTRLWTTVVVISIGHHFTLGKSRADIVTGQWIGKLEQRGAAAQCFLRHSKAILSVTGRHQKLLLCDSGFARVPSANQKSTFPQNSGARPI